MSRNLKIALIISIGIHVFLVSAVVIVNPSASEKIRPYTCINFLGPILHRVSSVPRPEYLEASLPEGRLVKERFPRHHIEDVLNPDVTDFLIGVKKIPDSLLMNHDQG